jgi:hypothetical protein
MLALFEILSLEGYSDYRDIVVERVGPVSCNSNSLFFFMLENALIVVEVHLFIIGILLLTNLRLKLTKLQKFCHSILVCF